MRRISRTLLLLALIALCAGLLAPALAAPGGAPGPPDDKGGGGGHTEAYGNNLSFPVIWSDGVEKVLRGSPGMTPVTNGEWWFWWGTTGEDPNVEPLSCAPDPDDIAYCDDGADGTVGPPPGNDVDPLYRAYLQKDAGNEWQADSADGSSQRLAVDYLDWGDNLESVDWYTKSQVRTEVVLIQDLATPMTAYEMKHTSGWGIDEVHGLAVLDDVVQEYESTQATVYSHCARLTIQKLLVERDDPELANLVWDAGVGEWTNPEGESLVNPAIFNKPVWEAGDGPGYYSAEINVKGKVIYGYTWSVRKLNDEGAGDYRITFFLDESCSAAVPGGLNTFFTDQDGNPVTELLMPVEESTEGDDGGDTGGGVGVIEHEKNLTYIDIRILERGGGGGGGPRR